MVGRRAPSLTTIKTVAMASRQDLGDSQRDVRLSHYQAEFSIRRLWIIFAVSMLVMFGTLFYYGGQIY